MSRIVKLTESQLRTLIGRVVGLQTESADDYKMKAPRQKAIGNISRRLNNPSAGLKSKRRGGSDVDDIDDIDNDMDTPKTVKPKANLGGRNVGKWDIDVYFNNLPDVEVYRTSYMKDKIKERYYYIDNPEYRKYGLLMKAVNINDPYMDDKKSTLTIHPVFFKEFGEYFEKSNPKTITNLLKIYFDVDVVDVKEIPDSLEDIEAKMGKVSKLGMGGEIDGDFDFNSFFNKLIENWEIEKSGSERKIHLGKDSYEIMNVNYNSRRLNKNKNLMSIYKDKTVSKLYINEEFLEFTIGEALGDIYKKSQNENYKHEEKNKFMTYFKRWAGVRNVYTTFL